MSRKETKQEAIEECNNKIKDLYESKDGGVDKLIFTSSHGKKYFYSKIVQIKKRNVKGKLMYDLCVNVCEKKEIKYEDITPVIRQHYYQIVECVPENRIMIKNVYDFNIVNEFFSRTSSCD